jgi:hypothetical protein
MAEGSLANLILFPTVRRMCWDCVSQEDVNTDSGVTSRCSLFDEEIYYEGQAETCDGWEKSCTP